MSPIEIDHLIKFGWVEIKNYFPKALVNSLYDYAFTLSEKDKFRQASIKNQFFKEKNLNIRRDSIFWIDNWHKTAALSDYKVEIDRIQELLREELRVSIKSFEGHLAYYSEGDYYKKHIDQHLSTKHRQVSFVTYLNQSEGGELIIYNRNNKKLIDQVIRPEPGKLVVFLSPLIFHEVKKTLSERFSLTGWYRDDLPLV